MNGYLGQWGQPPNQFGAPSFFQGMNQWGYPQGSATAPPVVQTPQIINFTQSEAARYYGGMPAQPIPGAPTGYAPQGSLLGGQQLQAPVSGMPASSPVAPVQGSTQAVPAAAAQGAQQGLSPAGLSTLQGIQAGIQGVGTIGNLWLGWRALDQAQEQFDFQKGMAKKNYANALKSYNDAVDDRMRRRHGGYSEEYIQEQIDKKRLNGK